MAASLKNFAAAIFILSLILGGSCQCELSNIKISQSPKPFQIHGKPEYKVSITCICPQSDVMINRQCYRDTGFEHRVSTPLCGASIHRSFPPHPRSAGPPGQDEPTITRHVMVSRPGVHKVFSMINCPEFDSTESVDPSIYEQTGGDLCRLKNGEAVFQNDTIKFKYAWDTPFALM
ncbi:hypothetical protein MKW94_016282 [Papaver nudicaule]|uniref:Uncharacterized protein n=1 Tax=Papaver nudicaule TaxID=74823 RepID=A0AA41VN02_PAPNU|nr:hypothetical protein [Papaver nudicaule]